jgi:hypothetical protein
MGILEHITAEDQDMATMADDAQRFIGELNGFRNMTVPPRGPVDRFPLERLMAIIPNLASHVDLRSCILVSKQWAHSA